MRVVLDTNVLLSALIIRDSVHDRILQAWLEGRFDLITHDLQLEELSRTSRHEKIRKLVKAFEIGQLINQLRALALFPNRLPAIDRSPDPMDNYLLASAEAAAADYLISGDKDGLLALSKHGKTAIVSPRSFLEIL